LITIEGLDLNNTICNAQFRLLIHHSYQTPANEKDAASKSHRRNSGAVCAALRRGGDGIATKQVPDGASAAATCARHAENLAPVRNYNDGKGEPGTSND